MWISRKKFEELERKIADLEGKVQGQQLLKRYYRKTEGLILSVKGIPTEGYVSTTHILSDYTVIQFAVPSHEWSELEKSREWRDFQALLERIQEEFDQQKHQAAES